ncbi:hypothetical protein SAMN02745225_00496 [Ferrithrix thermotolerans DSM 19514]|jgi:hypothetical protein|uniref:Uncharacterized protein n=1 Tax=Ferrithrix thermotolerans DSM 19514 TaxID=1121881 RepID=A0A1M4T4J2_9ACTN|nr:hypothetical protein [Ferrithrix thermotolerans]SHE39409.1 hypothetical protein SAMN02745225_00496 [Ferrithrix thermotolerans DSM 19514]
MSITESEVKERDDQVGGGEETSSPPKKKGYAPERSARTVVVVLTVLAISVATSLFIYKGGLTSQAPVKIPQSLPTFPKTSGHRVIDANSGVSVSNRSSGSVNRSSRTTTPTVQKNPFTPLVNTSSSPSAPQG